MIISTLIFFPILAAILLCFVKFSNRKNYFNCAIVASIINCILAIKLLINFKIEENSFQFLEKIALISSYDISYFVGVDGIAVLFVVLTAILVPICLLISINSIKERIKEFVIAFLLMEGLIIGSFCCLDLLLFYFFFEAMLIPMFLIIGIWGSIANNLPNFLKNYQNKNIENILWLAFFISFAIKVPIFPFHSWLPDAHVQAPTSGSVILAGILIKLGAFGFIRFSLPFFPSSSIFFSQFVFYLSIIGIIYGSLVALMQDDIKKMIAYSSIAHMGFVTMGIFSFNKAGIDGAIMQMISHGIVSGALFICVGVIYDRLHSKQINEMGGIANKMPNFAFLALIFIMGSVGLPGTSGFVGEFLSIIGLFQVNRSMAAIAGLGVILGACYMLWLYKRVWFCQISNPKIEKFTNLKPHEFYPLIFLAILTIILGIYPNIIFKYFNLPVNALASTFVNLVVSQ